MIHPQHFIDYVLKPTLNDMKMFSIEAVYLMYATAYTESRLTHLKQLNGPALGIFQIEPATYLDVKRYLDTRENIKARVLRAIDNVDIPCSSLHLVTDLKLSTIFARLKYWMSPQPLPDKYQNIDMYHYYKTIYNCNPHVDSKEVFLYALKEARKFTPPAGN